MDRGERHFRCAPPELAPWPAGMSSASFASVERPRRSRHQVSTRTVMTLVVTWMSHGMNMVYRVCKTTPSVEALWIRNGGL